MTEPFIPINLPVLLPSGKMDPTWWRFFIDTAVGLTTIDLTTQVTGILPVIHGGTGLNDLTFTTTGATNVTLPTTGTLITTTSAITAVNLNVTTGVAPNSGGIKHGRVTTGVIAGGANALVTLTWATTFASAAYTVAASVLDATAAVASLLIVHVETITAAAVAVRVQNTSGGNLTGTLHVIALHD